MTVTRNRGGIIPASSVDSDLTLIPIIRDICFWLS